jgi:putative transposase
LKERGLKGVQVFVSDKCLGLVENLADFYPEAKWQRCIVGLLKTPIICLLRAKFELC